MRLKTTSLSIYEVEEFRELFIDTLKENQSLRIDMQEIEKIDMAGIELLISLVHSAKALSKEVEFIHLQESVMQDISLLHLQEALGLNNG